MTSESVSTLLHFQLASRGLNLFVMPEKSEDD